MKFYRYEDYYYSEDPYHSQVSVELSTFYLVKETPKGYWISSDPNYDENSIMALWHKKKWVSKTSIKRFAYPTKLEAIKNFMARKQRQIVLCNIKVEQAKTALEVVERDFQKLIGKENNNV